MKSLPPSKVLTEVRKIAQRFPGSPAVTQGRIVIVESLLRNRFDDFRAALDRKKFGQAESILSELRDLRDEFKGAVEVDGALTLATNLLMREEREDRIRTAEQLVRRGEFVDATNMATDLLDEPDVSPAEREVAYRLLASIERKSMQMDISKYRESVDRYLQRKVATDESSRTLNRIEYILAAAEGDRSTTPILTKSDLAVLLGIAAVSAEVLKNDALRDDYLERLVKLEGDKGKTVAAVRKKPAPATVATPTPRPATNQRPQATATPKPRKPAARQTPTP